MLPLVQESCFGLLLCLLAAHPIPPLQTCSFQSQMQRREAITRVKREAACLGSHLRPAEVRATSRSLPPQARLTALLPLEHMIWRVFLWELGPTAMWKLYYALFIYLFICAALSFLLVGSTLCHAVRLHKYLLWETVGGVAQCKEYEAGMEWRAKAV